MEYCGLFVDRASASLRFDWMWEFFFFFFYGVVLVVFEFISF